MIYLDYAATTPILDEVLQAMAPFHREVFGNPSSVYGAGREAKKGMEEAREKVAGAIGAQPSEIVFTAGGTEADNLALKGAAFKNAGRGKHIVTVTSEHHAVLHSAQWLARHGFELSVIGVDGQGIVDLDELRAALRPETVVVSVMLVNNEVGTIQPIDKVAAIVREHSRALLHTDAVQGLGKIPVDVRALDVDLASFSAHKLGGPKGTGALFVKRGTSIEATVQGGGQERDFRSGTPNVAGIAGFGAAAEIAAREVDAEAARLGQMRDRLQAELLEMPGVTVNGAGAPRIQQTLNVCISRVEGESLLLLLDQNQIAASSGSACTSGSLEPSHVLAAMGVPQKLALGALRISIGRATTDSDLAALTSTLPEVVSRLRSIGSGRAVSRPAPGSGFLKPKAVVAMSGGVDSSVAAALMKQDGYDVTGIMLKLWKGAAANNESGCCSVDAAEDARRVCQMLDIPFYVLNFADHFANTVIADFEAEHAQGRTPNPCVMCNRSVKFAALLDRARAYDAVALATGHYARVSQSDGQFHLRRGLDAGKDQSYVLYMLDQSELSMAKFPVGEYSKTEIRQIASSLDLRVANKPESQDICFVPAGDSHAFIRERIAGGSVAGPIVNSSGRQIGTHRGYAHYTVGQRKGLGIGAGLPLFVREIRAEDNTVVVAAREDLLVKRLDISGVTLVSGDEEGEFKASVASRYRGLEVSARVTVTAGTGTAEFEEPQPPSAPGQSAVFYNGDEVLGGGTITGSS